MFNERNFFWKFVPISIKKNIVFLAIIFETVVKTACFGYRRLLWEENIFRWVFLIFIFALPEKMIPNWGQKSSACLAKRDFKSRDERFGVFWFFTKWTDISLKSKTLGKSWIKKSQTVRTKIFLLCWKSSEKQDTRQTPRFYAPSKVVEDVF